MKYGTILLAMAASFSLPAADLSGQWIARFTEDPPKTVAEVILDLKASGSELTGAAHLGNWPGDVDFTGGKIEGDRFSFTVVGRYPWWSKGPKGEASGLPRLTFTGAIRGDRMELSIVWDSVMFYGDPPEAREYELTGSRRPPPIAPVSGRI
jgi:hypothetical protein